MDSPWFKALSIDTHDGFLNVWVPFLGMQCKTAGVYSKLVKAKR